jgi:dolichol-phosphate mannosyltransferase
MSLISIVVPVYFNAPSLPDLLRAFQQLAGQNPADQFEFVFVDDGSGDNSLGVLVGLQQEEARVRIVKLSRNFGSIPALSAGMSQARGDAVAVISADLQDPPELIHDMLALWRQGKKVVIAARAGRDDDPLTSFLSNTFYSLFRRFALKTMPMRGFDFFVIDRQVCDLLSQINESNSYLMGLLLWTGFDPAVVTYQRKERELRYGRSMWTFVKRFKYFIDAFVAFSYMPIRVSSVVGIIMSILGVLYAAFVILNRLVFNIKIEGWSSLMVVLLIVSGVQMTMLGILGEYLWRTLEQSRRRPNFVIDTVIEPETKP